MAIVIKRGKSMPMRKTVNIRIKFAAEGHVTHVIVDGVPVEPQPAPWKLDREGRRWDVHTPGERDVMLLELEED